MLILLYLLSITSANAKQGDFPKTNKQTLFNACYSLYRAHFSSESKKLEEFFASFSEPDKAKSFYTAEALLKCYTNIDLATAKTLNEQLSNEALKKHSLLLQVDRKVMQASDLKATKQHVLLYEEIKQIKEKAEIEYGKYSKESTGDLNYSGFFILAGVLGAIFVLFLMFKGARSLFKKYKKRKYY